MVLNTKGLLATCVNSQSVQYLFTYLATNLTWVDDILNKDKGNEMYS